MVGIFIMVGIPWQGFKFLRAVDSQALCLWDSGLMCSEGFEFCY